MNIDINRFNRSFLVNNYYGKREKRIINNSCWIRKDFLWISVVIETKTAKNEQPLLSYCTNYSTGSKTEKVVVGCPHTLA
jgi:hypothetical protein